MASMVLFSFKSKKWEQFVIYLARLITYLVLFYYNITLIYRLKRTQKHGTD